MNAAVEQQFYLKWLLFENPCLKFTQYWSDYSIDSSENIRNE